MKPIFESLNISGPTSSFRYFAAEYNRLEPHWHYHPEMELVYIERGSGMRFIGDHISNFYDGDLILLGENIPHQWISHGVENPPGIVKGIHFSKKIFEELPEFSTLHNLFREANYGLRYLSPQMPVIQKLRVMGKLPPLKRLIAFWEILDILSNDTRREILSGIAFIQDSSFRKNQMRLKKINDFILEHIDRKITLNLIATHIHLTKTSFSRWFQQATGKGFTAYLAEIRIGKVCCDLLQSDQSISEIAWNNGFQNISHFNRVFKSIKGKSPCKYRTAYNRRSGNPL